MARKRKLSRRVPTNLTLDPRIKLIGEQLAYEQNVTLSQLVERLLDKWVQESKAKPITQK